jgi:hypothetical protein
MNDVQKGRWKGIQGTYYRVTSIAIGWNFRKNRTKERTSCMWLIGCGGRLL